jgi:hypothetical protein
MKNPTHSCEILLIYAKSYSFMQNPKHLCEILRIISSPCEILHHFMRNPFEILLIHAKYFNIAPITLKVCKYSNFGISCKKSALGGRLSKSLPANTHEDMLIQLMLLPSMSDCELCFDCNIQHSFPYAFYRLLGSGFPGIC